MKCKFCSNEFSNKQNLNAHQKRTKYCLKLQGVVKSESVHTCSNCDKNFEISANYRRHLKICNKPGMDKMRQTIKDQAIKIQLLEQEVELLRGDKKDLQDNYKELSITAVKRPTTSTKNVQINNYIKNMPPLLPSDITDNVHNLTLEHHSKGPEGK